MLDLLLLGVTDMGCIAEMPSGFRIGRGLGIKPVQRLVDRAFNLRRACCKGLQLGFSHSDEIELGRDIAALGGVLMHDCSPR